jgi:uncharacterized protein
LILIRLRKKNFHRRYGPWALVAGGSSGLGAEYARQLAARGLNLVLVARGLAELESLAAQLRGKYGVQVRPLQFDLQNSELLGDLVMQIKDLEIGLLVYNAAFSSVGLFFDQPLETHLRELHVNSQTPLALVYMLGKPMLERRRGGIIMMSSLSSGQGTPLAANYAATKAYNQILAEGLWDELRSKGVDVLVCSPSVVTKPGQPQAENQGFSAPAVSTGEVVSETLAALGRQPGVIPGRDSRMAAFFMRHLMPRRWAIQMMGRAMRSLYS